MKQHYVIEKLGHHIAGLRCARFGSSSEAIDSIVDQMVLTLGDLTTEQAAILKGLSDIDKSISDTEAKSNLAGYGHTSEMKVTGRAPPRLPLLTVIRLIERAHGHNTILKTMKGYLHADGYAGYEKTLPQQQGY